MDTENTNKDIEQEKDVYSYERSVKSSTSKIEPKIESPRRKKPVAPVVVAPPPKIEEPVDMDISNLTELQREFEEQMQGKGISD